jgi:hypothetical protein
MQYDEGETHLGIVMEKKADQFCAVLQGLASPYAGASSFAAVLSAPRDQKTSAA